MGELQEELDELTEGRTAELAVEREAELLGFWLIESFDAEPLPPEVSELDFALRAVTWGGRIDSYEVDLTGRDPDGETVWPGAPPLSATSPMLTRLAAELAPEVLELAAAHLLAAGLERVATGAVLGERTRLHVVVGSTGWWLEAE